MATFLLEIGTEELPADFARLALPQLEQAVAADLESSRLEASDIKVTSTPRRLVVVVSGLAASQLDLAEDRKGPPASQAFSEGQPTPAALGFARRCGIEASELQVRDTDKGPFVYARTIEAGRPTSVVLAELVPRWITSLQGRRFMRWGEGEARFSRPIRWLVALLDAELVPVTLPACDPPLRSDRLSRGHRLQADLISIATASSYASQLAGAAVQVDRQARGKWIREQLEAGADRLNALVDLPEPLLEELIDLVESPQLIEGTIDDRFLKLPPEVLSTVMRTHQRYVPLLRSDKALDPLALEAHGRLLPTFFCIGNGLLQAADSIRRGNERVLRARLADAEFFLAADRRVASIDRRDQLDRVTFAEGLGSLKDRSDRLEWCTEVLLSELNLDADTSNQARRAAHLCKHDLVSQMVGEFPELQGLIGGKYLLAEGEPRPVALAVLEHYLPRGAGDQLPSSAAGAVLAVADRLELLLSIYAKGERPSGSSDPYALRRAGNGLLQILMDRGWSPNLWLLLERACGHWVQLMPQYALEAGQLSVELAEFLRQRLLSLLEEQGMPVDLVQAVAGSGVSLERLLCDPADARKRAALLLELRSDGRLQAVQAVVQRASKLAEKGSLTTAVFSAAGVVDPELFSSPSEQAMLAALEQLEPIVSGSEPARYNSLAKALAASAPVLAAFFDGEQSVMVMAEDLAVRTNRLNLLGVLRNQASVLADFSRLQS